MINYGILNEIPTTRDLVSTFGGYNHNQVIAENEFYDMKNLSSDFFPSLSPRKQRGTHAEGNVENKFNGIISKDALCYVKGTKMYVNGEEIIGLSLENSPKKLVSMGAYIIIFPDKKYVNTANLTDFGDMESRYVAEEGNTIHYDMCKIDGTNYSNAIADIVAPENPSDNTLWIDTSQTPNILKQFSASSGLWVQVPTTYIKISAFNIAQSLKAFDGVKISGIAEGDDGLSALNNQTSVIWSAYHDKGDTTEGDERAEGTNDYIVVIGILRESRTQTIEEGDIFSVARECPDMDFVVESNNRLWGCKYGIVGGKVLNEIYACKLGDFRNWNCFMGISTDSYTASCGTDGRFTGAISYLGNPIFFKENVMHKVFGTLPSNYQIQSTECRGVLKGAGKSLAMVNEMLLYKSANGICMYNGSLPVEISAAFGAEKYNGVDTDNTDILNNGAVAGSFGNKYYISQLSETNNQWHLFAYDVVQNVWYKEDNSHINDFVTCRNDLYYINDDRTKIKTIFGSGTTDTEPIEWSAETGAMGLGLPDRKYISRINLRMSLSLGARVDFYVQYNSAGAWHHICSATGTSLRSFTMPIRPKRCDHFRIRINGIGDAKIISLSKTIEQGSDA